MSSIRTQSFSFLSGCLCLLSALLATRGGRAASLQSNVNYGASGAVMNVYVPDKVKKSPGIVVALHYCGGSAPNAAGWFTPTLAEQYGFIVIAPGLPSGDADGCWDVGSAQTQKHDGGSHSKAIVQMVKYAITQYSADPARVFAAGASSGAMMTNVLLGAYPDVFAAGSLLAGVPFGCWTAADGWTSACADGNTVKTAQQWGDLVRNAYPGYTGARPRVQLFHGTADTTLNYKNLAEEIKQWTNVFGLSETPTSTQQNTPKSGWTRTNYEKSAGVVPLQVSIGANLPHDLTGQGLWGDVIKFFALDQDTVTPGTGGSGGQTGSGGKANGGAGGTAANGGTVSSSGGAPAGGSATSGGSAGTAPTGGTSSGGSSGGTASTNSGGTVPSAGASSGGTASTNAGGTAPSGGATSASGGAASASGGTGPTTGGISSIPATGGTSGGTSATGGTGTAGSAAPGSPDDGSGCGCRIIASSGSNGSSGALTLALAGIAALIRRRGRKSSG